MIGVVASEGGCVVQMHNQAKSSVTSSLEKVQASKEKKEQELVAAHQALEQTNKKLQVCLTYHNTPPNPLQQPGPHASHPERHTPTNLQPLLPNT